MDPPVPAAIADMLSTAITLSFTFLPNILGFVLVCCCHFCLLVDVLCAASCVHSICEKITK
jgi:hypothetical protein